MFHFHYGNEGLFPGCGWKISECLSLPQGGGGGGLGTLCVVGVDILTQIDTWYG